MFIISFPVTFGIPVLVDVFKSDFYKISGVSKTNEINPREPFLSPSRRLEAVAPNGALGNWIFTSILESLESFSAFSSFYTRTSAVNRLQVIQSLGFAGPEMTRRFDLIKKRFTKP